MFKKLSVVLAALLATTVAFAPSASAYEPNGGGTFNVPRPWGGASKYRIVEHVERAIRNTRPTVDDPNPVIMISSFLFDRRASADALIAACKRNVSVRVIMDADISTKPAEDVIKALNGDNPVRSDGTPREPSTGRCGTPLPGSRTSDPLTDSQALRSMAAPTDESATWGGDRSYAKKCEGSCRGRGGNMHSKFYAFSKTGTAKNVVMVSSSNLNYGGAALGWNDLYTIKNRPATFDAYRQIHKEMTEDTRADDHLRQYRDGPYTHRFFPMLRASKSNDPTLNDLNRIGCRSAFGRTEVRVSQFYWAKTRGIYLARKIVDLARQGCRVQVIHAAVGVDVIKILRDAARRHQITLYDSRWDFNRDGNKEIRTHSKYVLVKGTYAGDRTSHQVMTGTANWVDGSLSRGDENTLNIALASAYWDYVANWNNIRNHSRKFPNRS